MSGVVPGSLRVSVDPAQLQGGDSSLRLGQIVQGRVVARIDGKAILDVFGSQAEVVLPPEIPIGASIGLRVLDVTASEIAAQIVSPPIVENEQALSDQRLPVQNEATSSFVSTTIRRIVDAAERLFNGPSGGSTLQRPDMLNAQTLLQVAIRGDKPHGGPAEFDPAMLELSQALASATTEELLAAQAALERLNVPVTALTVAAALPEANDPARLVQTLERVSFVLASLPLEGRIATLRTLADFLSSIRPQDEMIDAQISSFVDQIANGGESKLLALLQALALRSESSLSQRLLLTARATERASSLTNDLKAQLLAAAGTQNGRSSLSVLLNDALEAVTAAQLTSLNAASKTPGAIAFVLPIATDKATLAAQVTVQRDAPEGRSRPIDADNFRISFTLETRNLGTVRIDVETVARAVRLTIETQTTIAAERLRADLHTLRERFQQRGYRSVAMTAHVVRISAFSEDRVEEQRTYLSSLKFTGDDHNGSTHLDTRA